MRNGVENAGPSICGWKKDSRTSSVPYAKSGCRLWDLIEERFASPEFIERVRLMEEQAKAVIDNESQELILVGHAYAIAGEAGQIYRQYASSDHGIDGEIEFKDQQARRAESGCTFSSSRVIPISPNASETTTRPSHQERRAGHTTGSSRPIPSCWSSGPPTARSGGWT